MSRFYPLLNVFLVTAAIMATAWTWNAVQDYRSFQPSAELAADENITPEPAAAALLHRPSADPATSESENNPLWKRFLFSPRRSEGIDLVETTVARGPTQTPTDIELVGIGILDAEAAAVILVKSSPGRVQKSTRQVYGLGEPVEETGYRVAKISLDEVTLIRGDGEEERVLRLQPGDASSRERRRVAAARAVESRQATAAQQVAGAPPQVKPPSAPPAPPPGGPPSFEGGIPPLPPEVAQRMTEQAQSGDPAERLEELRKELQERHRKLQQQYGGGQPTDPRSPTPPSPTRESP